MRLSVNLHICLVACRSIKILIHFYVLKGTRAWRWTVMASFMLFTPSITYKTAIPLSRCLSPNQSTREPRSDWGFVSCRTTAVIAVTKIYLATVLNRWYLHCTFTHRVIDIVPSRGAPDNPNGRASWANKFTSNQQERAGGANSRLPYN